MDKIRSYYNIDLIKVLTGIRRYDKSIILKQIIDAIKELDIDDNHIIYINFEDFEYDSIKEENLFYKLVKSMIVDENKYYMFFDEIQHVNGFEKVIASFKSTINTSIFIYGSNSKLLSSDLATLLVGRTVEFKILPFIYKGAFDYLTLNGNKPNDAFSPISDSSPKYVLSLDKVDMTRDGICHLNIVDFLLGKIDLYLS